MDTAGAEDSPTTSPSFAGRYGALRQILDNGALAGAIGRRCEVMPTAFALLASWDGDGDGAAEWTALFTGDAEAEQLAS